MQKMKTSEEIKVLNAGSVNPAPLLEGEDVLDRILRTKTLRVGFDQSRVPFTFYNMHDELVGFDIDMAMALAKDLGVSLVFVPCKIGDVEKCLANDEVDIIMSGMYSSIYRAKSLRSSVPYMNVTFAMVVKDHLREQCDSLSKLLAHPELNIAIIQDSHLYERGASLLPHATFFHIEEEVEFFENTHLDIMVVSAEEGSAWTLMYPQYRVIQPLPRPIQFPVVYLMGRNAPLLDEFLDTWVPIVKNDGTVGGYYDYWILGRDEAGRQSRWSIMKDVLGWVD